MDATLKKKSNKLFKKLWLYQINYDTHTGLNSKFRKILFFGIFY